MHPLLTEHFQRIEQSAGAVVVRARDGGPIRTLQAGGARHRTGFFVSRKCGRAMPWQSPIEEIVFRISEADPGVTRYLAQPHRLEMRVPGRAPLIYFPDVERRLADGSIEVLEAKSNKDRRYRSDADYQEKLERAADIYGLLNWRFAIVEEDEVKGTRLAAICERLVAARGVVIDPARKLRVLQRLQGRKNGVRKSLVLALLGDPPVSERMLDGLVLERLVTFDFFSDERDDPRVRLVRQDEPCLKLGKKP